MTNAELIAHLKKGNPNNQVSIKGFTSDDWEVETVVHCTKETEIYAKLISEESTT